MEKFLERHGKVFGVILIVLALGLAGFFLFYRESDTDAKTEMDSSAKKEEYTIQQDDKVPQWDGDSVALGKVLNYEIGDFDLPEEVLAKIDHDTALMAEQMQLYLLSEYEISDVRNVEWDGLVTLDYITHKVALTFDVTASADCTVQCIYEQEMKQWSFYKFSEKN